jgi:hypothetical protein
MVRAGRRVREVRVGKNAEQVAGIKHDAEGKAAEADLASVATVTVSPMQQVVLKALQG